MVASAEIDIACNAARAIAGAVLRATGSRIIEPSAFISRICSAVRKRCSSLHTTIASPSQAVCARSSVVCNKDLSLSSFKNCLGYKDLDNGQRRVPDPPARTTGRLVAGLLCISHSAGNVRKSLGNNRTSTAAPRVLRSRFEWL